MKKKCAHSPFPARLVIEAGASREKSATLLVGLLPHWDSVFWRVCRIL
jgi:hypothetical protein